MIRGKFLQYGGGVGALEQEVSPVMQCGLKKKQTSLKPTTYLGRRKEASKPSSRGLEKDMFAAPPSVDAALIAEHPLVHWLQKKKRVSMPANHLRGCVCRGASQSRCSVSRGVGTLSTESVGVETGCLTCSPAALHTKKGPGHFFVQVCSASFIPTSGSA